MQIAFTPLASGFAGFGFGGSGTHATHPRASAPSSVAASAVNAPWSARPSIPGRTLVAALSVEAGSDAPSVEIASPGWTVLTPIFPSAVGTVGLVLSRVAEGGIADALVVNLGSAWPATPAMSEWAGVESIREWPKDPDTGDFLTQSPI